jgi:hypothetical protein
MREIGHFNEAYLYGGVCEQSSAKELILLGKSLEKYVENPLCIGVASVCQKCDLGEHNDDFCREIEEALARVLPNDDISLIETVLAFLDEGFVLLRILYKERCVFKKFS